MTRHANQVLSDLEEVDSQGWAQGQAGRAYWTIDRNCLPPLLFSTAECLSLLNHKVISSVLPLGRSYQSCQDHGYRRPSFPPMWKWGRSRHGQCRAVGPVKGGPTVSSKLFQGRHYFCIQGTCKPWSSRTPAPLLDLLRTWRGERSFRFLISTAASPAHISSDQTQVG